MLTPAASRRLHSTTTVSTVAELTAAVANASIGRILLVAGTYAFSSGTACTASYDPSALCISRNVSLEALEPGTVVLNAQGTSSRYRRVLCISAGTVDVIGLNITGGYVSAGGGGMYITGSATVIITGTNIYSNQVTGFPPLDGGGISINGGTVSIIDTNIYSNQADGYGGGVEVECSTGDVTFDKCEIHSNTADTGGGGMHIHCDPGYTGTVSIVDTNIYHNQATVDCPNCGFGGGIFIVVGTVSISGTMIYSNQALIGLFRGEGGGIFNTDGTVTIAGSKIFSNQAKKDGGGIVNDGLLFLHDTVVTNNTAQEGGGILNNGGLLILSDHVRITSNHATKGSQVSNPVGAALYELPTPPGTYLPNDYICKENGCQKPPCGQICNFTHFPDVHMANLSLVVDDPIPFHCPRGRWCDGNGTYPCDAGLLGDGTNFSDARCGGECPLGAYCPPAIEHCAIKDEGVTDYTGHSYGLRNAIAADLVE